MQTRIEPQAVENPNQVSQFSVIEMHLQGANPGLTTAEYQEMLAGTRGSNLDRLCGCSKGAGNPTHQVTGVGQHHVDQSNQMIKPTLQLGSASPIKGPARDDSQSIWRMTSRNIWKAFQVQAAALLCVDKGLFHRALLSGHRIDQAGPQPLKASGTSAKGQSLNKGSPLATTAVGIKESSDAAATRIHALAQEVGEARLKQLPAHLQDLRRLGCGEQPPQHGVETIGHGTENLNQGIGLLGFQGTTAAGSTQWIMAATLPQLHPIGEEIAVAELLAHPNHRLTAIEIEGLGAQQHQVKPLNAPTGKGA
jgi:hypothetical protein